VPVRVLVLVLVRGEWLNNHWPLRDSSPSGNAGFVTGNFTGSEVSTRLGFRFTYTGSLVFPPRI
jgi:hypothetical protein